jgi:hypothetical protein
MATEQTFNGNDNDKNFTVSLFPFLRESHIKVQVGGQTKTLTTDYTVNGSIVQFITAPESGTNNVRIYRDTPFTPLHDYSAGSTIKADALNENHLQLLYAVEEAKLVTVTAGGITTGSKNDVTVNSNSDWVVNANAIETAMIASDQVTYDKIQDIGTANRVLGKASTGTVEEVQVATDMVANDAVTLAKMAGGTDGNLITYDASGDPAYVATGDATQVLTSNGAGAAPTFQNVVNVPTGTVIWYAKDAPPKGYLKCNGDTIANGNTAISGNDADGDAIGTINTAALYAIVGNKLPDLRGEFIRGINDGRGNVDETGSTAHAGTGGPTFSTTGVLKHQTEGYKAHAHDTSTSHDVDDPGHHHDMSVRGASSSEATTIGSGKSDHATNGTFNTHDETTGIDIDIAVTVESEGQSETRPRNVALLACIKY